MTWFCNSVSIFKLEKKHYWLSSHTAFLRKSWNYVNWLITDPVTLLHTHCTVTSQALAGLQQQRRIRALKVFLSHLSGPFLWQMSPCQKWEHLKTLLAECIPQSWKAADWHTQVNEISLVLHAVTDWNPDIWSSAGADSWGPWQLQLPTFNLHLL